MIKKSSIRNLIKHNGKSFSNGKQTLLIGTITGGLLGAGLALLLTPKKGMTLRSDLYNTYQDLLEKSHEYGEYLPEGKEIIKQFQHFAKGSNKAISNNGLLVGGLAGVLLGAGLAYALKKNGQFKFPDLGDVENKTEQWLKTAKNFLDAVNEGVEESEITSHIGKGENKIDDILELANMGFKVYQSIKGRR